MSMEVVPSRLGRRAAVFVALLAALVFAAAAGHLPLLRAVELRLLDWRLRAPHPAPPTDDLLIVAMGPSTFEKLKKWGPSALDRAEYVPVIDNLSKHGARLVAVDVHFGEERATAKADEALAQAIARAGNVILVADAQATLADDGGETVRFTPPASRIASGALTVASPLLFRPDNRVRWVQPLQRDADGSSYTALSFEVARIITTSSPAVSSAPVMINWAGPDGTVDSVKFEELHDDLVDPSRIAGRIVFIGVTEQQKDVFSTPVGPMSGVEIHAQATATMLSSVRIVSTSHTASLVAGIVLCLLLAFFATGRRAWQVLLLTAVLLALWTVGCYLLFRVRAINVPMTGTIVGLLTCGVLLSLLQSERVATALSRLWPSWVSAEGEEIEATVLVCDMAGYTARSEDTAPGEIMELMRQFFATVDKAVGPHGGILARRPGDAAIVFFRAEEGEEHHTARAVQAALSLRDRLTQTLQDARLGFGITLTTGTVSLGFVGTSPPEPQILGDPVNVAFRLQSETRRLGETIIADWPTATADPQVARAMRPLGQVQVKGRREPVQIFAPERGLSAL